MTQQDDSTGSSFRGKACWTDEDPWPYIKRTLAVLVLTVGLPGASGFAV